MKNSAIIIFTKLFLITTKGLKLGNGSTWPGHIALKLNNKFVSEILKRNKLKTIIIAGTNGKTTVSRLVTSVIENEGDKVIQNSSGANLLNGLASLLITSANHSGKIKQNYAVFEVDENTLPIVIENFEPDYIVVLNLFRDQLDRYGEIDSIAKKWITAFEKLSEKTQLLLNGDDPLVSILARKSKAKKTFFGLNKFNQENVSKDSNDSVFCPDCGTKLTYKGVSFSHLGNWNCSSCGLKRPKIESVNVSSPNLSGTYNQYNLTASLVLSRIIGIPEEKSEKALKTVTPAFGRQETLEYKGKNIRIFLSKNPTSFNESLRTISELGAKDLLIVLNDRIPDGKDISWIWDTNLALTKNLSSIIVSGDRTYDMGLRVKYSSFKGKLVAEEALVKAIEYGLKNLKSKETLYILPTYSAMLETRRIITGKKIL